MLKRLCSYRKIALLSSLGCAIYAANLETVPYTNRRRVVLFPISLEKRLGELWMDVGKWDNFEGKMLPPSHPDEYWIKLRKSGKFAGKAILPPSHPDDIRVQKIAKEIFEATRRELRKDRHKRAQTAHVEEFNWEIVVMNYPNIVDSTYMPGGKIVIFTGMLREIESDAEMAAIIGHEVGHIVARHYGECFYGNLAKSMLQTIMSSVNFNTNFDFRKLSRRSRSKSDEIFVEADYIGLLISAHAGYDPQAALRIWKTIGAMPVAHPSIEERAQLLSHPNVMGEALSIYSEALSHSDS